MANAEHGCPRLDDSVAVTQTAAVADAVAVVVVAAAPPPLAPGHTPERFPAFCADGEVAYGQRCWHLDDETLEVSEVVAVVAHSPAHDGHWSIPPALSCGSPPRLCLLEQVFLDEETAVMRAGRTARDRVKAARDREAKALAALAVAEDRLAALRAKG